MKILSNISEETSIFKAINQKSTDLEANESSLEKKWSIFFQLFLSFCSQNVKNLYQKSIVVKSKAKKR